MEYRKLGRTGIEVSELSFGTWAIGGSWGKTDDTESLKALDRAMDAGVNFFDTADVYGDGHAEQLLAQATKGRDDIYIASKFCRGGDIHDRATYSENRVRMYCENSLRRLGRDSIDLYQIHCPPSWVIEEGEVFQTLDTLQQEGKIRAYGVSVETVDEGLKAIEYSGVQALQVIFNIFRQKPLFELFPKAEAAHVGILARVPLASGLLTGKFTAAQKFEASDHRNFNADGQQFNVGETFAGLPFQVGVELAGELAWIQEGRGNMARAALRYILDQPAVTCAIPGFKSTKQIEDNLGAIEVPSYTESELAKLSDFYQTRVHHQIRGVY